MPRKVKVNIPKGSKDCNGVECDKNYEFDLDIPETTTTIHEIPQPGITIPNSNPQQVIYQVPPPPPPEPKEEKKEDPHETLRKSLPSGVNFAKCEGGDCGHKKLKNPKTVKKFKACPHCKSNSIPKNNDFCPTCGLEEEDKNFEEWEESDIEIEDEEEEDE